MISSVDLVILPVVSVALMVSAWFWHVANTKTLTLKSIWRLLIAFEALLLGVLGSWLGRCGELALLDSDLPEYQY